MFIMVWIVDKGNYKCKEVGKYCLILIIDIKFFFRKRIGRENSLRSVWEQKLRMQNFEERRRSIFEKGVIFYLFRQELKRQWEFT